MELLISAVNANAEELIGRMNVESSAVLVNQCGANSQNQLERNNKNIIVLNRDEKGVGKSRNLALQNSTESIVLFSDDDIVYKEGYADLVEKEFEAHPEADILLFNMEVCEERRTYWNEDNHKVTRMNCGRYPAYSIAARREKLVKSGVKYSELFGGGAKYSNGEDSLFLMDCLRAGLKLYSNTAVLGKEEPRESTWFHGYTEKFFFDRGVLFAFLYGKLAWVWALRFVLTKKEMFQGEIGRKQGYKLIKDGIKQGKAEKRAL